MNAPTSAGSGCAMRIYVDFDDVLCETAQALADLAGRLFGIRVPYEAIHTFDLREAFSLDQAQYEELMVHAHEPHFLQRLEPAPAAIDTLARWQTKGFDVTIVTGRPYGCREASEPWFRRHGLAGVPVMHVDKYAREPPARASAGRSLTRDELDSVHFDLAIDDAPVALDLLAGRAGCRTVIFDRPWNRSYQPRTGRAERCRNWQELATLI